MIPTSATLLQRLLDRNDGAAWDRFVALYEPLLRRWLAPQLPQVADLDDVTQQVLTVVLEKLPAFEHSGRAGAFRAWLRAISTNCLRKFWRSRPAAGPDPEALLLQLEDSQSALSQQWDREHDEFILRRVLELVEPEFTPKTWTAFRRVALEHAEPEVVAAEVGMTVNAVCIAKSRVLRRLREEIEGFV
jgi:RNA polymerase sigma-70 factor (ECF subfamily)